MHVSLCDRSTHLCPQEEAQQEQQGQVVEPESHPTQTLSNAYHSSHQQLIPVLPDGAGGAGGSPQPCEGPPWTSHSWCQRRPGEGRDPPRCASKKGSTGRGIPWEWGTEGAGGVWARDISPRARLCPPQSALPVLSPLIKLNFWWFPRQGLTIVLAEVHGGLSANPDMEPCVPCAHSWSTCSKDGCANAHASTSKGHTGLAGK